ncbi:MAG: hypothetical protein DWQ04_12280 [Chloroflexi bacterium]|nr:MAG: hypothetical protein DWQ04_12280 [Chloroflexota bacterium]
MKKMFLPKTIVLLSIVLLSLLAACTQNDEPIYDLSTDEGVQRAYEQEKGEGVQVVNFCMERPSSLQDIILVGFFADDAGCLYDEMFVDGELGTIRDMTAAGLAHNGWADESQREALALIWAEAIIFVEVAMMQQENDDFISESQPFSPPSATLNDDGSVTLEIWVEYPGGMLPETTYKLHEIKILADGSPDFNRVAEQFTINYGG